MLVFMITFIAITGVVILFLIVNKINGILSNKAWDKLLIEPGTDSLFKDSFGISNFTYIVAKVLKPLKISHIKFMSNVFLLAYEDDEKEMSPDVRYFSLYTPSIRTYKRRMDRPSGLPVWFIAAFPDIVKWISTTSPDFEKQHLLYEGISEKMLKIVADKTIKDSHEKIDAYRVMVENYLAKVRSYLETQ